MPVGFTVRIATPTDDARVSDLLKASYTELMPTAYDAATLALVLPAMTRANPALLATGTYFVAETVNGHIVGCGGWTKERPGSGDVALGLGHIRHFATHPNWLGRAIGRTIYDSSEAQAHSAGIRQFECYASLNAEGFYAALGFTPVRRVEVQMGEDMTFPSILMVRSI
ncbi:MAG: GNAT family N-acetyltransferase [Alphaproteobacteria bacterium]|nr:GNAT family N-acetyltransferase [Alphaproteobacteria bacterium]